MTMPGSFSGSIRFPVSEGQAEKLAMRRPSTQGRRVAEETLMSNVTPIRSGQNPPLSETKESQPRASRRQDRFALDDPSKGPSCTRVIQALHGVCQAAEELASSGDSHLETDLATAAEILSSMLKDRLSSGL